MSDAKSATQWNIMISSRMKNFESERQAAKRGIVAAGMSPWIVEDRPNLFSHTIAPNDLCRAMAEQCDLLLLILGPTYGYQPDGQPAGAEKSATQMEYEWARARRPNKVLVFLREDAIETEDPQQRAFINTVGAFNTGYTFTKFNTPEQLEVLVSLALLERRTHESLDVSRYLEAVRDAYEKLINPITGAEMDTTTTVLLQLRTEVEDQQRRRTWEEALGEASRDVFHPLAQFKRFLPTRQSDRTQPIPLTSTEAAPEVDSANHFLSKYGRIVLLGDPGAGKSTLLRRLAFSAAQRGMAVSSNIEESTIPIFVTAVELSKALLRTAEKGLVVALSQALREQGIDGADIAVDVALSTGRALVLVDGLDEVAFDDQRTALFEALRRDAATNQAILSARPSAYQEGILTGWRVCEVQQLDAELRLLLINSVFQQITRQTGKSITVAPITLKNELDGREDLRAWAGNPLLLTLIASQYALNGNLPRQRAVIYRLSLDRLIDSPYRQVAPRQQQIARDQLEEMLERLALHMMERSLVSAALVPPPEKSSGSSVQSRMPRGAKQTPAQPSDIAHLAAVGSTPLSEAEVRELVERSGVIQRQSGDQYGFIHLTFQEYFAARALANPNRTTEQRQDYIIQRRLSARWEQVTLLLVSELDRRREQSTDRRDSEADVLVRALFEADTKRIRRLGGRDPLHLALIRASAAQRERTDALSSSPLNIQIEQRWSQIWNADLMQRLPRFDNDGDFIENLSIVLGLYVATFVALLAGVLADIGLRQWIKGSLGVGLGVVAAILITVIAVIVLWVAAFLISILSFSGNLSGSSLYPDQSVLEERAGQEMSASNKLFTLLLQHRPDTENQTIVLIIGLLFGVIWLLILGISLALVNLPFTAATGFSLWLRLVFPYGLLVLTAISLASAALWRIALVTSLRADGADRLVENRGAEDIVLLAEQLTSGMYRTPARRGLQRLGPAAVVALPQIQAAVANKLDVYLRVDALAVIGSMGAAATPAIPVVVEAASAVDQQVRVAAATTLAQLKHLEALDANVLLDILQELAKQLTGQPDPKNRDNRVNVRYESERARDALIKLGPAAMPVLPEIEAFEKSDDILTRDNINRVLKAIRQKPETASSDRRSSVFVAKAGKLVRTDSQSIKMLRRKALHSLIPEDRREAIAALVDVGPQKVVLRTLIVAMRDRDSEVRVAAVDALGRLGSDAEPALPFLLAAARDRLGTAGEFVLRSIVFLAMWPPLVVFLLQQVVVNRSQASFIHWLSFLPTSSHAPIEVLFMLMKSHTDFLSFLVAASIYLLFLTFAIVLHFRFCKRRHVVRDAAMRVLPAFLANIEKVNV